MIKTLVGWPAATYSEDMSIQLPLAVAGIAASAGLGVGAMAINSGAIDLSTTSGLLVGTTVASAETDVLDPTASLDATVTDAAPTPTASTDTTADSGASTATDSSAAESSGTTVSKPAASTGAATSGPTDATSGGSGAGEDEDEEDEDEDEDDEDDEDEDEDDD